MKSPIWIVAVLVVIGSWSRMDSQVPEFVGSGPEEVYASRIRVEPDTLSFVWSQIGGYGVLAAGGVEEYVSARELMDVVDRNQETQSTTDATPGVVELARQEIDTLQPPWEGPFYVGWSASFRVEYEATKLEPSQPARIIGLIHGVASPTPNVSKECSVFIWESRDTRPGARLYGAAVSASVQDAFTVYLNYYSAPQVLVDGPFWVGNYEMDTLFPTSALDSTVSHLNVYSEPDSIVWQADQVEYFHGAVVSYNEIFDTVRTMVVYNDGDSNLDVSNIEADESWVVSISPLSFSVPAAESQLVTVEVTKDGLVDGTYEATLTLHCNDPSDSTYDEPVKFVVNAVDVAEESDHRAHPSISLRVNPNPTEGGARITYEIPREADIRLSIYDRSGRLMADLVDGRFGSGPQSFYWNGSGGAGRDLPAGIYFCTLSVQPLWGGAETRRTIKMVVLD